MFESELLVPNNTGKLLSIWVEPWAFSWEIPKDAKCKFFGDSEIEGTFELVERGGELEIYGWSEPPLVCRRPRSKDTGLWTRRILGRDIRTSCVHVLCAWS